MPTHLSAFICPVTGKFMSDPVLSGGRTIDRTSLPYLNLNFCGQPVVSNSPLKTAIDTYNRTKGDMRIVAEETMTCQLSKSLMVNPVTDFATGETYEKSWIDRHLATSAISPLRNASVAFVPNRALQMAIEEVRQKRPNLNDGLEAPPALPSADDVMHDCARQLQCYSLLAGPCENDECRESLALVPLSYADDPKRWQCQRCLHYFEPDHIYSLPGAQWSLQTDFIARGKFSEETIRVNAVHHTGFSKHRIVEEKAALSKLSNVCIIR